MKRFIIWVGVALVVGHILTEAHSVLYLLRPDIANQDASHLFFIHQKFFISAEWFVKMTCDQILICATYLLMAYISRKYSKRLFYVVCVYFFYHVADTFLLFLNWKQGFWKYYILLFVTLISTIWLLLPEKKAGKLVSME